MSRIGEMKGALSNEDLKTLQRSLQSLSLRQSKEATYKALKEIVRLTEKGAKIVAEKYGAPAPRFDVPEAVGKPAASAPQQGGKSTDAMLRELGVM
jgi:hypothetical protein